MSRPLLLALATAAALTACGPSEDNFFPELYASLCEKSAECYNEAFYAYWDDIDACVQTFDGYEDYVSEYYADCEYSRSNARKCLKGYDSLSCDYYTGDAAGDYEDVWDACDEVWTCE